MAKSKRNGEWDYVSYKQTFLEFAIMESVIYPKIGTMIQNFWYFSTYQVTDLLQWKFLLGSSEILGWSD